MIDDEPYVIELDRITKTYGNNEILVTAIDEMDLKIKSKSFMAIMGQSGSGKTTLLHVLGCLHKPSSGVYKLDGINVSSLNDNQLSGIRNSKIGFIFQKFNLLNGYNIVKNVELPLQYMGIEKAERKERAIKILEKVGLKDRLKHKPSELSGGQVQRVAIARALVTNPAIILGDEMTGNLDSATSIEIMELMVQLHDEGSTIIYVTHSEEMGKYANEIIWMSDGKRIIDHK